MGQVLVCSRCKQEKGVEEFWRNRARPRGYQQYCKECNKAKYQIWRKKNPEKHKVIVRRHMLKQKFGMSETDYLNLLEQQNGVCAVCGLSDPASSRVKHFHVDHDHKTGKVRGLLCGKCNTALGLVNDDAALISKMIGYLQLHGT